MFYMKRYILALLLFISFSGYSQNSINNYKYVIVPEKFSFQKQNDQYGINSLTRSLLESKGFTVYLDNGELPAELANNKCNALNADLSEKSTMFTTGLTLLLKDCQGNVVFKSKEGKSREKEYNVSYNLALRAAFESLKEASYVYNGTTHEQGQQIVVSTPSVATPAVSTPAVATPAVAAPVVSTPAVTAPITTTVPAPAKPGSVATTQPSGTLYAQAITNGYQLIDTTPKIVLTLLKTSVQDYFIAGNGTANGIVFKKGENWFFEYYKDGKLIAEKLLVKF